MWVSVCRPRFLWWWWCGCQFADLGFPNDDDVNVSLQTWVSLMMMWVSVSRPRFPWWWWCECQSLGCPRICVAAADNSSKNDLGFWSSSPRSVVVNSGALFEGSWVAITWPWAEKFATFTSEDCIVRWWELCDCGSWMRWLDKDEDYFVSWGQLSLLVVSLMTVSYTHLTLPTTRMV